MSAMAPPADDAARCAHGATEMCGACTVFVCPLCDDEVPTGESCRCGVSEEHFGRWGMPAVPDYRRTREEAS